nr:NADH dehydrogenase subunit 6 [Castor fiber subsp. birulai]WGT73998.1 NADH dehydrogenase subunit 6 [Castor fiber subsp. birulai]
MTYSMYLLSIMFMLGFVGFSSKPSPIYGGFGLVVSGGVGCGLILSFGGSFLGLMVFLVYLGGMMVVFGYTTAMAIEDYPETWGSNVVIWGALVFGLFVELVFLILLVGNDEVNVLGGVYNTSDWVVYSGEGVEYVNKDVMGVAAVYSYGSWLMVLAGWSLFVSIFIVLEITRGR